jgi:hypothetical protein
LIGIDIPIGQAWRWVSPAAKHSSFDASTVAFGSINSYDLDLWRSALREFRAAPERLYLERCLGQRTVAFPGFGDQPPAATTPTVTLWRSHDFHLGEQSSSHRTAYANTATDGFAKGGGSS